VKNILDGIRVIELTEALAGPYCAMLLGDFGADVIKVERPKTGDQSRGWGPPFIAGESAYFLACNRNKRSVVLDYDKSSDGEVLQRLLATADVFVTNQPSLASLRKRDLDPETLRAKFPRLIHCSITGYGFSGPKAERPGYDILAQAESGMMSFTGEPGGGPMRYPIAIADMTTGMYAAMGILAALFAREKTGRGQFLDMALFDSQLTWLANVGSSYLNAKSSPRRWGNAHPNIVPYQVFPVADGHIIIATGNDNQFAKLCNVLGEPKLAQHPDYRLNPDRLHNRQALVSRISELTRRFNRADLLAKLEAVQVPAGPINSLDQVFSDPQVLHRGMRIDRPSRAAKRGSIPGVRTPIMRDGEPMASARPSPLLGEHTAEILREIGEPAPARAKPVAKETETVPDL
jgi:crotonobetainyl-CoA:carnitine CoA-transferase CaiB-like acyl-CoA transferase